MRHLSFPVLCNSWDGDRRCVSSEVCFVGLLAVSRGQWKRVFLLCLRRWIQSTSWHLLALARVGSCSWWMAINGQTLTLKLSFTLPLLITLSETTPESSRWISKLLKIEGIGQIDFSTDRLLLKQSENMSCKYRRPPLHLWVSSRSSLFLKGCGLAGVHSVLYGCQSLNCSEMCLKSGGNKQLCGGSKLYY